MDYLPVGNRIDLAITGLVAASDTDTPITDATITFSIFDSDDTVVPGVEDVAVNHVATGNYRGGATPTTAITAGELYRVVVSCSDYDFTWDETFYARDRAFDL